MLFDAPFFSMTSLEATGTDPQQRLMLEVAYESLENGENSLAYYVGSTNVAYSWYSNPKCCRQPDECVCWLLY